MKRLLPVVCLVGMLVFVLVGCSNSGESKSEGSASQSSSAVQTQPTNLQEYFQTFDDFTPIVQSGTGNDVVTLPYPDTPCLITYSNTDDSISLVIYDNDGKQVDLPVMHFAPSVNSITTTWGAAGTSSVGGLGTQMQVSTKGNWNLSISSMKGTQPAINGGAYNGSQVLYIDDASMSKLTFTAVGTGTPVTNNIMVYAAGIDGDTNMPSILKQYARPILTDGVKDSSYSGSVVWTKDHTVLMVDYPGDWTVSW